MIKMQLLLSFILFFGIYSSSNAQDTQNGQDQVKTETHTCCDTHKPRTYFGKNMSETLGTWVKTDNLEAVKQCVNRENVNYNFYDDSTGQGSLLCRAIIRKNLPIVLYLLEQGASVDGTRCPGYIGGETPLELAVMSGSLPIIRCLVEHGANVNMKINKDGATILFSVIENIPLIELQFMLKGFDLEEAIRRINEEPCRDMTIDRLKFLKKMESLLDESYIINLVNNIQEIIRYIIQYSVDINAIEDLSELFPFVSIGERTLLDLMEVYLHENIKHTKVNTEHKHKLKIVLIREYTKIIDYLIQIGAKRASEL